MIYTTYIFILNAWLRWIFMYGQVNRSGDVKFP